jgi:hypothetical protein
MITHSSNKNIESLGQLSPIVVNDLANRCQLESVHQFDFEPERTFEITDSHKAYPYIAFFRLRQYLVTASSTNRYKIHTTL